jgi:hypothetical protein
MGITYNKNVVTKDRRIMPSGPADRQRKQRMQQSGQDTSLIEELRNQIAILQKQLSERGSASVDTSEFFTADQVNDEIVKAIKVETAVVKSKYEVEINKLKSEVSRLESENNSLKISAEKEVASLKEIIKDKDLVIEQLKSTSTNVGMSEEKLTSMFEEATKKLESMALASMASGEYSGPLGENRPKMEPVFVDPIEKESEVEKHLEIIEDVSITEKEEMNNKVSKLKNLLGKLPTKKF